MLGRTEGKRQLPRMATEQVVVSHQRKLSHQRMISHSSEAQPPYVAVAPMPYVQSPQHHRMSSGSSIPSGYYCPPPPPGPQAYGLPPQFTQYGYSQMMPLKPEPPSPLSRHQRLKSRGFYDNAPPTPMGSNPYQQSPLVIYHLPNEPFMQKEGALELLCLMLSIPVELVAAQNEDRSVVKSLKLSAGGLLAMIYPIVQFKGRAYVQWVTIARHLATLYNLYGVDIYGDYYADAILDSLRPWQEDQAVTIQHVMKWLQQSEGKEQLNSSVYGYLAERQIYYRALIQMFDSYSHLYRHEDLGTSWIDPLVLTGIVDDIILDTLLSRLTLNTPSTQQLMANNHVGMFYEIMTTNGLLRCLFGAALDARLQKAQMIAKTNENQPPQSAILPTAVTTSSE